MTVTRRKLLATAGVASVGSLAGCLDWPDEALSSTPATVDDAALAETGYDERTVEELPVERTVGRFGFERTIRVTNWYAEYDRSVALGAGLPRLRAAVVSVLSTPQIEILGRTVNPVGEYSADELVALLQDRYEEIRDVRHVDDERVSILGTETTLARYRARARLPAAGTSIDVSLAVAEPVPSGDDFVLGVAVFPQVLGFEVESGPVRTLLEGIEHE